MEKTHKKLLYICPHLSTGGQPQYAYKQIKHFIKEFDIEVVEVKDLPKAPQGAMPPPPPTGGN